MWLEWVGPMVLTKQEVRRIPRGVGGVYMLHVWAPQYGAYPIYYVGRSRDLRRRLLEHLRPTSRAVLRAMREVESAYWSAAPIADSDARADTEASLIALLDPPCNQWQPKTWTTMANLPALSTDLT